MGEPRQKVGQAREARGLPQGPAPTLQLGAHDGHSAQALHCEHVEDNEGGGGGGGQQGAFGAWMRLLGQARLDGTYFRVSVSSAICVSAGSADTESVSSPVVGVFWVCSGFSGTPSHGVVTMPKTPAR